MILKKKLFLKSSMLKKKFKKQFLKEILHTKDYVLILFTPLNAQILRLTCVFEKHNFEKNFFF